MMQTERVYSTPERLLILLREYLFIRPYYGILMGTGVWKLINRRAIQAHRENRPALDSEHAYIVKDLKQNGIAISSLEALFPDGKERLAMLQKDAERRNELGKMQSRKTYLRELMDPFEPVDQKDPFGSLVLDTGVLHVINSYFDLWGKFYYHALNIAVPTADAPKLSQRWHRDPEDRTLCKLFVYLTDVDENAGPFTYIRESQYGGKWHSLFPPSYPRGRYPKDGTVEAQIPASYKITCTGKAGTVIFADTGGLHRGGYATGKERRMYTAGYVPPSGHADRRFALKGTTVEFLKHAEPEIRFAFTR